MKKIIIIAILVFAGTTAQAGDLFGAALKPIPSVTLFGQKLSWPIPSMCVGAKAGVIPDAGISPKGFNFKVPYFAIDIPFPSLTVKSGTNVVELKLGAVDKNKNEGE
tara:strand:+ start:1529 stop:1849 length:321 start_codon:yes stop_codon:yes gene_type:complete